MASYTAGPWKTIKPGHGHATDYLCVQIGADETYTTLEMLPADAHLTAAAPDLYRELDTLLDLVRRFAHPLHFHDEMRAARAALDKARGEAV